MPILCSRLRVVYVKLQLCITHYAFRILNAALCIDLCMSEKVRNFVRYFVQNS